MLTPVLRILAVAAVIGALVAVARNGPAPETPRPEQNAMVPDGDKSVTPQGTEGVEPEDSSLRSAEGEGGVSAPAAPTLESAKEPDAPRSEEKQASAERTPSPPETPKPEEKASPSPETRAAEAQPEPLRPEADEPGVLLPSERAERERQAQLNAPIPPSPPKPKRLFQVRVEDSGTLKTSDMTIRLDGIAARPSTTRCKFESGGDWPCGAVARTALVRLIRGRSVECVVDDNAGRDEIVSRCTAGKTDISQWLVRQGWAEPASDADKILADAHDKAKEERLGFWQRSSPNDASLR